MLNHISRSASCLLFLLTLAAGAAFAQVPPDNNVEQPAVQVISTVTASATAERVRFSSPNTVVQLRLEVYDEAGQKLVDTEQRGGNVLDWHFQGGAGERVPDGVYLCVLTSKNLSGRLSQKLGRVTVSGQSTAVRSAAVAELNLRQAQTVGPVEIGEAGLTVMGTADTPSVTVLANNGDEGQLARTRGALTFRVGDFFSGNDKEQMRLTEDGNLGIGTTKPKAKLDVAGVIRAREGFMFSDGSKLNVNEKGVLTRTSAAGVTPSVVTTQNQLAKFTDNAGTVGDSVVTESAGNIGIGTVPAVKLDVAGDVNTSTQYNIRGNRVLSISGTGNNENENTFVGYATGNANSGNHNSFVGGQNGVNNGSGSDNSFFGAIAGYNNTSGAGNSFFGSTSGEVNQSGGQNSFFGYQTGLSNNAGAGNSFFGAEAGYGSTDNFNSFFGQFTGYTLQTGSSNTFIGAGAAFGPTSGSNNTLLGGASNLGADNLTNATAIGASAVVSQSNSLVLGAAGVRVGIGTTAPTQTLDVANGRIVTTGNQTLTSLLDSVIEVKTTVTNNGDYGTGFKARNTFNGPGEGPTGLDIAPTFAPTTSIGLARGFVSAAFFSPPPGVNITEAYGGDAVTIYGNNGGTVTNGTAFAINSPFAFGSMKPIRQYGLHINNQGLAGINTSYGLFVDAQSGSSNNYSAIFAGGNVGIGTSIPAYKVHVVGQDVRVEGNTSGTFPRFSLNFTGGSTDEKRWQNYASPSALNFTSLNDTETAETFWLQVNRGTGTAISSVVLPTGNVGIGTSSPHAKLQVAGGNIYVPSPNSLIITSPNGTCWFITVANAGTLSTIPVPCP